MGKVGSTGVWWGVSFRAFDERGVEGLPVALAALLRGLLLSAAVLSPPSAWQSGRGKAGADPLRFFVPLAALGARSRGFAGGRGWQRTRREMRCCYETCYESDFVLVTLRS